MLGKISDYFRMWVWAALALAILFFIGRWEHVLVVAYKGSLVCIAAFLGYWIDRNLFGARAAGRYTKDLINDVAHHAAYRRALIVAATILAFALGL